ncbi:unnamed protein product [Rangifer tarandus platyrhynchus]|uniref:Uncharacterized protein n=2 Tax=Rangifer tarandus platyrhynchus TaxID=3082113 RepID=A0AC59Y7H8_RANTA|nr:unnamed protein product [Rangifer tarandus platyrhynchus]
MTANPRAISIEIIMGYKEKRLDSVQSASEYNIQFYPYTRRRIYVRTSSCSFYMILLSAHHQLPMHTAICTGLEDTPRGSLPREQLSQHSGVILNSELQSLA